jgi:hypothetical protein
MLSHLAMSSQFVYYQHDGPNDLGDPADARDRRRSDDGRHLVRGT